MATACPQRSAYLIYLALTRISRSSIISRSPMTATFSCVGRVYLIARQLVVLTSRYLWTLYTGHVPLWIICVMPPRRASLGKSMCMCFPEQRLVVPGQSYLSASPSRTPQNHTGYWWSLLCAAQCLLQVQCNTFLHFVLMQTCMGVGVTFMQWCDRTVASRLQGPLDQCTGFAAQSTTIPSIRATRD